MKKVIVEKSKTLLVFFFVVFLLVGFSGKALAMSDSNSLALSFAKDYLQSMQSVLVEQGYLTSATGVVDQETLSAFKTFSNTTAKPADVIQTTRQDMPPIAQTLIAENVNTAPVVVPTSVVLDDGTTVSPRDTAKIKSPQIGDTGNYVIAIQSLLADQGYLQGGATGVFDQTTQDAIKNFQSSANLPASGFIDSKTLLAFGQISKVVTHEIKNNTHVKKDSSNLKPIPVPMTGVMSAPISSPLSFAKDYLKSMQYVLVRKGYLDTPTGALDEKTTTGIAKFQTENNLIPTGMMDIDTSTLLINSVMQ